MSDCIQRNDTFPVSERSAERDLKKVLTDALHGYRDIEIIPAPHGEIAIRYMIGHRVFFTTIRMETKPE